MAHLRIRPTQDWWNMIDFPNQIFDQHFGLGMNHDEFLPLTFGSHYMRPRRHFPRSVSKTGPESTGTSQVTNDSNEFKVQLDVSHFAPEELTVKAMNNHTVIIEGKHEEKQDEHGYISRQFSRKYLLPKECDAERLASSLTPEGVLVISAPKHQHALNDSERMIPITMGPSPAAVEGSK